MQLLLLCDAFPEGKKEARHHVYGAWLDGRRQSEGTAVGGRVRQPMSTVMDRRCVWRGHRDAATPNVSFFGGLVRCLSCVILSSLRRQPPLLTYLQPAFGAHVNFNF